MWDVYSKNFAFRGIGFLGTNRDLMKKYMKEEERKDLEPLTNYELIKLADQFLPLKFGNILHGSSEKAIKSLKRDAESAYPLIYECFYGLLCEFLEYKLESGSTKEKDIYNGMTVFDLINRLLTKRCATAFGRNDNYLLATGESGQGDFSKVGTDEEESPLLMESCLTQDEIKLSGFLLISSKVTKVIKDKSFGVIMIGIPFPIFNYGNLFDTEDIFVTKFQNTDENGYGKLNGNADKDTEVYRRTKWRTVWNRFYNRKSIKYTSMDKREGITKKGEVVDTSYHIRETYGRFWKATTHRYVDLYRLAKRFSIMTIGILKEANTRAKAENKMAYILLDKHKMGFGFQPPIYEEIYLRNFTYEILFQFYELNNIEKVHLVDFKEISTMPNGCKMYLSHNVHGIYHPNEGIDIKYSTRDEFQEEFLDILENDKYLLVDTYRLDQNALPGNQFWMGKVEKELGHPSYEVRNTAIPFIHNPHINKTRICGDNLHIYSMYSLLHWTELKMW